MTDDVRPEVIKTTQDLLGKYFKKPPLTEKLLKKPPFRFLHDIISAVIRETGFLEGLFTEQELNSENIKEKEAKLAYLAKLIDAVKLITGANLSVRPSKIISGQEATKTNELLQAIGKALDKKINSSEAIEHYKRNADKKTKLRSKSTVKEEKKDTSRNAVQSKRHSEKEKSPREQKRRSSSTSRAPANDSDTRERSKRDRDRGAVKAIHENDKNRVVNDRTAIPPAEPVQDKTAVSAQRRRHGSSSGKSKESTVSQSDSKHESSRTNLLVDNKIEEHSRRKESASRSKRSSQSKDSLNVISAVSDTSAEIKSTGNAELHNALDRTSTTDIKRTGPPENEVNEQTQKEEKPEPLMSNVQSAAAEDANESTVQQSARPRTSLRPPSARPVSARPAAPRVRAKTETMINEEIPTPMGNISVIVENSDAKDDDDADDMVVMETRAGGGDSLDGSGGYKIDNELTQEHGHLVAQILETQRELVNTENVDVIPKKTDIAWDTASKREREVVAKEVDKLRETLQTLTRATNPLGKLMDYIQEDVEMMRREYADWKNQSDQLNQQLEMEKAQTRELIEPMKETLKEIEDNMQIQLDKICQTKSQIMKNDQKIQRLLNGQI